MAGKRYHTRTLSVCSNSQRAGLCCAAWLMRLPQEDFCQALGVAPLLKYEADGDPVVRSMAPVLRNSVKSAEDLRTLVATQILFGMLAAPDSHVKNFAAAGRRTLLAGLALRCHVHLVDRRPRVGQRSWHKAKMAVAMPGGNRHPCMKDIERRHFNALGALCGLGKDAEPVIHQIIGCSERVILDVSARLPQHFAPQVADTVLQGLRRAAARLQSMPCT